MDLQTISKAIAGGLVSAIVAELAHFGFQPNGTQVSILSVVVTGLVAYAAGHILVFLAPANKTKTVPPTVAPPVIPVV